MMKKQIVWVTVAVLLMTAGCRKAPAPTVTPDTATPTVAATIPVTEAPTEVPTVTPTATPVVTPTAAPTATPTVKPTPKPTPKPTATPKIDLSKGKEMYVAGYDVNVRQGASLKAKSLTKLQQNDKVTAYLTTKDWVYVQYAKGKFGYISEEYLSAEKIEFQQNGNIEYQYNSNIDINDNVFLDALAYTGYKLDKHRADGNMWKHIPGSKKKGMGYLSGLGYDYGASTGYERNGQGLPDIARMKKRGGLVCASYLTYVYFNYLPNVAGIDTSKVTRPANPCSAQSWREAAEKWVKEGVSKKISFTAKKRSSGYVDFKPKEDIPIGSIVVYKQAGLSDSSRARHVAIYAGYAGGYHWTTHVGNDRGPEMITMEYMGYSDPPLVPVAIITPPINFEKAE